MSVHNHGPVTHTEGLQDDCDRCAEMAEKPTDLDSENLKRIWSGTILTRLDMVAYNNLYRAAVVVQRLEEAFMYELGPDGMPRRVRERSEVELWKLGGKA